MNPYLLVGLGGALGAMARYGFSSAVRTLANGFPGMENLAMIPGSVGASPVQNIGAYGQEVADVITRVEFFDYQTYETEIIEAADMNFGYRDSIFKQGKLGAILWVEFKLATSTKVAGNSSSANCGSRTVATPSAKAATG